MHSGHAAVVETELLEQRRTDPEGEAALDLPAVRDRVWSPP
jgi:hypothetical protein